MATPTRHAELLDRLAEDVQPEVRNGGRGVVAPVAADLLPHLSIVAPLLLDPALSNAP
jgi:hypothetical protein